MGIGRRVRRQRKKLGLTLRNLTTRIDLSASFLNQIENDQATQSFDVIQSTTMALVVPVFCFLEDFPPSLIVACAAEHCRPFFQLLTGILLYLPRNRPARYYHILLDNLRKTLKLQTRKEVLSSNI